MLTKTTLANSVTNNFVRVHGASLAVVQTAAPTQLQAPGISLVMLSLTDEKAIEEFKEMVRRATNTWGDAPEWMVQLRDHLNKMPND